MTAGGGPDGWGPALASVTVQPVTVQRLCSKTACGRAASCTLTYNYADSTIVLGPLAVHAEPHSYDLCADHANRMTAPRGWDIVRLANDFPEPPPAPDELVAIADAVRAPAATPAPTEDVVARPSVAARMARTSQPGSGVSAVSVGRKSHLHVVQEEPAEEKQQ